MIKATRGKPFISTARQNGLGNGKNSNSKIYKIVMFFCFANLSFCKAQQPEEVYKKPLKEILASVEKTYHVKLKYDDKNIKDMSVNYATWRFTSDVKNTLDNILKPLDLIYRQTDQNTYEITQYEYYRRSDEEGKKHLDELLSAYPNAEAFNKRKKELRECILKALGINMSAKRTSLNPIVRPKVIMDGYSVENVAFESITGYFVTGTLYKPIKGKSPFPVILCPMGIFITNMIHPFQKIADAIGPICNTAAQAWQRWVQLF